MAVKLSAIAAFLGGSKALVVVTDQVGTSLSTLKMVASGHLQEAVG